MYGVRRDCDCDTSSGGTLELWFAPRNSSFFKGWKQKLAVILPLYAVTFGIWFVFFS
ncbi:hypothetical protein [Priestia megaterium]|uniref:hypothetical protein n=1 Tax=Priestia megaterium TaxID=1404 RepID=UPI001596A530|nr:hypothetical protein [Priestia megaterium]